MSGPETWSVVWNDPRERLIVERQQGSDIARHRFRSNAPGDGAVVVPLREDGAVLFIEIYRPALGQTLWELPRGQAEEDDAGPLETAQRELLEETGHRMGRGLLLGEVYPDSGLSGDGVHVVVASGTVPVQVDECECPQQHWLSPSEIRGAIRAGKVRDAITLAALSLRESLPVVSDGR